MKLRIIKEEGVYRIQAFHNGRHGERWDYASKAMLFFLLYTDLPMDFKTQKEAEYFVEYHYVVKVVKEYEVE